MIIGRKPHIYNNPYLQQTQKTDQSNKPNESQEVQANQETQQQQDVQDTNAVNNTQPPQKVEPKTPPEVAQFMQSIGVSPTNSKEGDKAAIDARLNVLEAQATNTSQLNEVKSLRSVWADMQASAASGGHSFQQSSTGQQRLGAMDQMAMQNKMFFKLK
ncbi:MAG: hypothetical protein WCK67_08770 [bacterium]